MSLSWREPIPVGAPGANGTEYEIRYYEKVSAVWAAPGAGFWGCGLSPCSCFLTYHLAAEVLLTFFVNISTDLLRPEFLPVPSTPCLDPRAPPLSPVPALCSIVAAFAWCLQLTQSVPWGLIQILLWPDRRHRICSPF